ncbi:hypothetical protein [Nocardioides sp.]|uniref:hypothetical protein n=1 Tax=Nocardioides sp. TaxID=35761 RepID=UPI0025DFF505|nr:hypothetical protein [Nocardioides sp.]
MIAIALVVLAIAVIGWLAYAAGNDDDTSAQPRAGRSSATGGATGGGSPSPSDQPRPEVTADGMEGFIEDYLATVTTDTKAAWEMLTPGFQDASGGFGRYNSFWKKIATADVLSAEPDPASRQISYTVEYQRRDGSKTTDDVTLRLDGTDERYLISGES